MERLILGAGSRNVEGVTLDLQDADVIHDLNELPYPFEDDSFEEIHAYEVLEHCGTQGDFRFFFAQFNEFHRILKPKGRFICSVPRYDCVWAYGDPGHTRVLPYTVFSFLLEKHYTQLGLTSSSDYRHLIQGYWLLLDMQHNDNHTYVVLESEPE